MPAAVAYSYIRFSTPKQQHGDSLRRQTEATEAWCKRNKVQLDTSLTFQDLGVSGLRGRNRLDDTKALAQFLKAVEKGHIPKDSYLVIENLDRLSREDVRKALRLWMEILDAGINIVQLHPQIIFRHDKYEMTDIMLAVVEMSRGHSESHMKSIRASEVCKNKRKRAAETGEALSGRVPSWIKIGEDGKPCLIEERAAVLRQILQWAAAGYGSTSIVKKLKAEGVKPFGKAAWSRQYIAMLLRDERVIGKLQPLRKRKTDQPKCLENYYPPAATEEEWFAARAGIAQRKRKDGKPKGGRFDDFINLFSGLLWDAPTGEPMYSQHRPSRNTSVERLVMTKSAAEGRGKCVSFPLWTLEQAILSSLEEIDPKELSEEKTKPDEVSILSAQIATKKDRIASLNKALDEAGEGEFLDTVQKLGQWRQELKELEGKLQEAQQRKAHPREQDLAEGQELIKALKTAKDQKGTRMRLRAILGRIIDSIWLLVVPEGRDRYCSALIIFKGGASMPKTVLPPWVELNSETGQVIDLETGEMRTDADKLLKKAASRVIYIHHKPPKSNGKASQPGGYRVSSWAESEYVQGDKLSDPVRHFKMLDGFRKRLGHPALEWHPLPS